MLTTLTAPAFAKTWDIADGDITVKAGEAEGPNKVKQGDSDFVKDEGDTIITGTSNQNTVTIEAENKGDKVEVTLKDVNINVGSDSGSALTSNGDVTLTLKGDNSLTGGNGGSGISSNGSLTITGGENDSLTAKGGSGRSGIFSSGGVTISGGTVNATGGSSGSDSGDGIHSGSLTMKGGTVNAKGGSGGTISGGYGIISNDIDLSGSLELTAKAGSPNGKALSRAGHEFDLDTIKDKLDPGAKVTTTDADGKVIQQVSIPRPVEPEKPVIPGDSSSSSGGGSADASVQESVFPGLVVTDKDGQRISYTSTQSGNTLTVCVGRFTASLHASLSTLRQLRAEGIDTITFQTILCSTTLSVDELLALGGEDTPVALAHSMGTARLTVGGADHSELLK